MKIIAYIDKVLQIIYDYIIIISGSIVTILIMTGAFMRYILKTDFYGSEEIILIFGYWLYFIGSISASRSKTHLNADMVSIFTQNPRIISIKEIIKDLLSLAICCVAIKWCYDYWSWTIALKPRTSVHKIPYYFQQFPMCLAFFMWGFYLIRDCVTSFLDLKNIDTKVSIEIFKGRNA
ncbi:TRAP transporter small permease subunit [Oceanispirochaeta crateris]|uniref:TRAP transporter small permease subunit n=1 Tax=Oceanispirochaeta crateris TaxID=2518645 RepID=A0A5C1QQV7_9SPIO|nr:TRAP transporter small permease subunit [Oceanispirochaeta crateris]QEN09619.1 TRAP transporter small permease subunit [Oceanispirochaeta crateris]